MSVNLAIPPGHGIPIDWLLQFLEQQGLSLDRIAKIVGMEMASLQSSKPIVAMSAYLELLNWAATELDDPMLGLTMANNIDPGSMGLIGYLASHSSSLGEALQFMQRYHDVFTPDLSYRLENKGKHQRLIYSEPPAAEGDATHDIVFSLAMCIQGIQDSENINAETAMPLCSFTFPESEDSQQLKSFFGEQLRFSQPSNFIEFDRDILERPNPHQDASLLPILLQQANQLIDQMDTGQDLVKRLRLLLMASLDTDLVTTETAAKKLNMSVRSLHRHLSQKGTSFRKVREEVIIKVAQEALLETGLSITQIAVKLHYSETSAFDRLFKRVVGESPREYRQKRLPQ